MYTMWVVQFFPRQNIFNPSANFSFLSHENGISSLFFSSIHDNIVSGLIFADSFRPGAL